MPEHFPADNYIKKGTIRIQVLYQTGSFQHITDNTKCIIIIYQGDQFYKMLLEILEFQDIYHVLLL